MAQNFFNWEMNYEEVAANIYRIIENFFSVVWKFELWSYKLQDSQLSILVWLWVNIFFFNWVQKIPHWLLIGCR